MGSDFDWIYERACMCCIFYFIIGARHQLHPFSGKSKRVWTQDNARTRARQQGKSDLRRGEPSFLPLAVGIITDTDTQHEERGDGCT